MNSSYRGVSVLIGTGFHRWVLGAGVNSPLCDWSELLRQVSHNLRVALPDYGPSHFALAWEALLLRMVSDGYRPPQSIKPHKDWINPSEVDTAKAEKHARHAVNEVLKGALVDYPFQSVRARFIQDLPISDVISLNFDSAWSRHQGTGKATSTPMIGDSQKAGTKSLTLPPKNVLLS